MTSIVSKPWGSYQVIEAGEKYIIKRIVVKPGGKLSLQSHQHRTEHWVVVTGEAEVTIEEDITILHSGEYILVPFQAQHRLTNLENGITLSRAWRPTKNAEGLQFRIDRTSVEVILGVRKNLK